MTIELTSPIPPADAAEIAGWGQDLSGVGFLRLVWRPKDVHVLLRVDGRLVSRAGLLKHHMLLAGRPALVAGLGAVVTRPDAQRRGHARAVLERAHQVMCREWGADFGLLFCLPRLERFYLRLGWSAVDPVIVEQPPGPVAAPLRTMVHTCRDLAWPSGAVRLDSPPW